PTSPMSCASCRCQTGTNYLGGPLIGVWCDARLLRAQDGERLREAALGKGCCTRRLAHPGAQYRVDIDVSDLRDVPAQRGELGRIRVGDVDHVVRVRSAHEPDLPDHPRL